MARIKLKYVAEYVSISITFRLPESLSAYHCVPLFFSVPRVPNPARVFCITQAHALFKGHNMTQTFYQAPLPFTGQKRRFLTAFKQVLNQCITDDGTDWTIVDVFGGSGLLAHTAKRCKPAARVIYNDFDDYATRLQNINDTNRLRQIIFDLTQHIPRNHKLPKSVQTQVQVAIQSFDGFVDLPSVASWLLFSGRQTTDLHDLLTNHTYFNSVRMNDYPTANDYLDGLEITSKSYADLLPEWIGHDRVLFLFDPPYICTAQGAYRNETYFGMVEFLKLMRLVQPPFIFFSSTRSEFLDYLDLVVDYKLDGWERFEDYHKINIQVSLNKNAKYEDNLVYKLNNMFRAN